MADITEHGIKNGDILLNGDEHMIEKIKRHSPLTEATFYILLSLCEPLHGYGIIKKVEVMSNGRLKLAAGTLYGAISALHGNRLIQSMGEDVKSKRRKLYMQTEEGLNLIRYEIRRLEEMVASGYDEIEKRGEYEKQR